MVLSLPRLGILLLLSATVLSQANVAQAAGADSEACGALERSLEQQKPDTQLQRNTPLYIAAENDRGTVVHQLLAKGADPNLARNDGLTSLTAAAFKGNNAIVADLLAHHANPNTPDNTEKTAILYAAAMGFTPVVRTLLNAGVDAKAAYGNDLTALMWAAGYADGAGLEDAQNVAKLLIEHGARLDAADNRGRTALMIAAETGHLEMVNLLLLRGANRALRDKSGKSAADLAASDAVRQRLLAK
jgi:ankyrin repeat protein